MKVPFRGGHHIPDRAESGANLSSSVAFRGHAQGIAHGHAKQTPAEAVKHIHGAKLARHGTNNHRDGVPQKMPKDYCSRYASQYPVDTHQSAWDKDYRNRGRLWGSAVKNLPDLPAASAVQRLSCAGLAQAMRTLSAAARAMSRLSPAI